jgi:hypothetical protein
MSEHVQESSGLYNVWQVNVPGGPCQIVPDGQIMPPMMYFKAFGPVSHDACAEYIKTHCPKTGQ